MNAADWSWLLAIPILLPFLGAATSLMLARYRRIPGIISVTVLTVVLAVAVVLVFLASDSPVVLDVGGWAAPVGITLVADQLSALMLMVSVLVTLCVLIYSQSQELSESTEAPVAIFHPTFLILSAGVSNVFVTGDLFNMYVGFEILLVSSFVLITLGSTRERIRSGTVYVIVSLISSAIFLIALALVYAATGTVNIAQLAIRMPQIDPGVAMTIQMMLLVGFGVKAAVFPLSAWLPDSYPTAPASVTAVFAGLLTKVGVYAIIRTQTLLFGHNGIDSVLLVVGLLTMVIGILGAVAQDDLKRLLSFTLISHIGFVIWGVGLDTVPGLTAAIFYTAQHIIVQTALFLVAGLIEYARGATSLTHLGGLLKASPLIAALYLIPALNLAGIPPMSGFLGKVGLLSASVESGTPLGWTLLAGGLVTSLITLYAVIKVWNMAFWQDAAEELSMNTPPRLMRGATAALVIISLLITVFAAPIRGFASRGAVALTERTAYIEAVLPEGQRGTGLSDEVARRHQREAQSGEGPVSSPTARPSSAATPSASGVPAGPNPAGTPGHSASTGGG